LAANYKDYLDYINRKLNKNEDVPTPFVKYMYAQSPEQSLCVYLRVDRRDETIARLRAMRDSLDARREGRPVPAIPKPQPDEQQREIRLTARLVANAIWFAENEHDVRLQATLPEVNERLAKLAAHDQWWARLYVVEIMRRHRELQQDDVLRKLTEDENELVNEAARLAQPLAAPRVVDSRAVGPTSIQVTWEPSVGATSYAVQRRQPDTEAEFTTIAEDVSETTYTDNSGAPNTLYQYRVVARQNQ
jgi:hypothetical protein